MGARFSTPLQSGPGAHPASRTMGTGTLFPGVKRPEHSLDHPDPSSAEGKHEVSCAILLLLFVKHELSCAILLLLFVSPVACCWVTFKCTSMSAVSMVSFRVDNPTGNPPCTIEPCCTLGYHRNGNCVSNSAMILTGSRSDSLNPAVIMMVVVALDVHRYFLHVVMMDCVHLVRHVYDVMFAVTCSTQQFSGTA